MGLKSHPIPAPNTFAGWEKPAWGEAGKGGSSKTGQKLSSLHTHTHTLTNTHVQRIEFKLSLVRKNIFKRKLLSSVTLTNVTSGLIELVTY